MDAIIERLNSAGAGFVRFALPMLVQSGVLILILLAVDLLLRKRVRAVFRYWIWLLVLAKLVLPSSLSSPLSLGYFLGDRLADIKISEAGIQEEPFDWEMIRPAPPLKVPEGYDFSAGKYEGSERPASPVKSGVEEEFPKVVTAPVARVSVTWEGAVFLVWLMVAVAMGLLLLQRAMFVRGLIAQAREAGGLMKETLKFCVERMGVKAKVRLKVSANAASPAVCGLFRPVIMVPANLGRRLGARDLRAVLLHELAHIKRGDLWVNLAQTLLQIVYFYNPLLWLANAMIRRVREQAVDEMVLVAMGDKAKSYPETLVNVAKLAFKQPALSLRLIGVVESKNALAGRVKRMLTRPIPKSAKLGVLGLLAVIIMASILLPMAKADKADVQLEGESAASEMQKKQLDKSAAKKQNVNEEVKKLLSKLQRLENEHLKIRKDKLGAMSESEKRRLMTNNMAVMSGLEKELRRFSEETATQLAGFGEPAVPILLKQAKGFSWQFYYCRGCIGDTLRQIGRLAVPYLIQDLQGRGPAVKVAHGKYEKVVAAKYKEVIITTLGQIGDPRAVEPLLDLFEKNKRAAIRWTSTIATALGLIDDKRAVEPLISELDACLARAEKNGDWDAERLVMRACVGALGQLGDKRAVPVLKRALQAGPQKTKAGPPKYLIAEAAAAALRQLGVKVQGKKGDYRIFEIAPPSQKPDETKQERPDGARVIYVDADTDGANNGSSWVDAYRYLQDALAVARSGDDIRVAQGVYKPDQGKGQALGDRQRTFRFGHTIIKGGYAGFGSFDPNERDIARFETILSGDLNGDDGPDFANTDDNSSRVVTNLDGALLDGFTITGGNSDGSGAGMTCVTASTIISNCTFRSNAAVSGGAMFISGVKPKRIGGKFVGLSAALINCKFIKNSAMRGGAIVINDSSPKLRDCTFIDNSAVALTSSSGIGGAIRNVFSDPKLTNCEFRENSAQRGGAIFNQQSNPIFEDCTFVGNTVRGTRRPGIGSAIYNTYSNPTLTGCTFSKNSGDEAGPIHNSESSPILTGCRFNGGWGAEGVRAAPEPEGVQQQRDYEAARNVPQPIEFWKVKKFGCGGNPRTTEKLQTDTKRHYPIVLTWPLIQNASKYVVQVRGVRGCRPTTSFESVTNSLRLEEADITPGRYQWAVSVYDQHGKFMGDIEPIEPVEIFAIADPDPVEANGKKVMIDLNHSAGHMRGWGYYNHAQYMMKELLENAGFDVEVNERDLLTAERLKSFDLLICHYYWAGSPGFRSYLQSELSAVRQFVEKGGSLLVVGCDRKDGAGKMSKAGNELVKEFAFLFDLDKISQQHGVAEPFPGQNVISFGKVIPVHLPVGVEGENAVTLLQFDGAPIAKARQIGSGKVIIAGAGMSFLDCYLGDFESREPLHLIMFYDFVRYLTDIDWKKNCKQDFVETILSRCQFRQI